MKVLNKFTIKSLKLNKKRTIVTIIGIMLSTALICGVTGLVSSFQKTLIKWEKEYDGNYHTTFQNVPSEDLKYIGNNEKVESYFITNDMGWATLTESKNENKPYIHILGYDKKALEDYGVKLLEGRMPQNSSEIIISEHIRTNARVNMNIGEQITLNVGERVLQDGTLLNGENPYLNGVPNEEGIIQSENIVNSKLKTYTIVGVMKRPTYVVENYSSPGYTAISFMEENQEKTANISVLYENPKEYDEVSKSICDNLNIEDTVVHKELLRYQGVVGDGLMKVLYSIAAVVIAIIVVSSVFVIRNSFNISVSEKNRQYGMLASIGATSKQIKKNVLFEGLIIGLIAIPLGILLGVIAIIILLKVVNYLLGDMLTGMQFIYSLKLIPVIISIIISFITIYLSCLIPARRAAKISPIESIRGNNDIKLKAKKVKTSKFTRKLFGIGGVIASKNLKRSKKKYRTTVISIVISIFIFISLSSFLTFGTKITTLYYTDYAWNLYVAEGNENIYEKIAKLDNINSYAYYYETSVGIDGNKYCTDFGKAAIDNLDGSGISVIAYNNEYFKKYIKELGLDENSYKTAAVLIDEVIEYHTDNTKSIEKLYDLKPGDTVDLKVRDVMKNATISKNTDKRPMGLEGTYYTSGMMIVSKDFIKEIFNEELGENYYLGNLFINSDKNEELENTLNDLSKENLDYSDIEVMNFETMIKQQKRMILVVSIFLYGFIGVITLIGVTNIFNTITTNMILRSKEFAMLKSVGMTTKEFNRMIRLESIMYGLKSLIIGIPLGIIGSYFIYKSFAMDTDLGYTLPVAAILISIVFVFIIIGITMRYSLNKINKQNIIETIRKDNI